MQLTVHTDYALRVLIYLSQNAGKQATISEIAEFYQISRNHLMKVVHHLAGEEFIHTTRGKHGGMVLSRAPELISIGEVVHRIEPNFKLVECFDSGNPTCAVSSICNLKGLLYKASKEFLAVLDSYTLADAITMENAKKEQVYPVSWLSASPPIE